MSGPATRPRALSLFALPGIPMVQPGDDLAALIADGYAQAGEAGAQGDVLVVAQKIVSKSEGRYADLAAVEPGARARDLAGRTGKDARLVELILGESRRVVRHRPNVIIVEHQTGFRHGDTPASTAPTWSRRARTGGTTSGCCCCRATPTAARGACARGCAPGSVSTCAVIVNDSVGRAWRVGTVGLALGAAGLPALLDLRGRDDLFGRPLEVTQVGLADELAAAASLLQGEADEGMPAVVVRGLSPAGPDNAGAALIRDEADDLFR